MISTLRSHRTVVVLPTEFTAHRLQRMFLTRRHATRMALPAPIVARRALHERPAPVPNVPSESTRLAARSWSGPASVLIMVAIVALAVLVTGLRV